MFKKSRRKIVVSIMAILVSLWVGTLSIIYVSSYIEMSRQNEKMLRAHADMYNLSPSKDMLPPDRPAPNDANLRFEAGFTDSPMFKLSRFYSVAINDDKEVLEIRNDSSSVHSDDELKNLALDIVDKDSEYGHENNLSYYKTEKNGYTLIAFMDNTVVNENAMTLFRFTLVFGGVCLIVFFFISVLLARKIVKPLEESYIKQKRFISDAGHELKTPVSVVSANADLLEREIGENKWLSNIRYENERMGILIGQLLELARSENVTLQMEQIDLSRLVAGEVLPFESVAYEKGIVISSNIVKDIHIEGNSSQLKEVVSILLDNAIRHSKGKDEVYLNLTKEHAAAILSVINKGDEIPKEQCELLFERFYRVDNVRNSEDKHYGLGLAIAKSIVDTHKGQIKVKCYDGLVEFKVKLPLR